MTFLFADKSMRPGTKKFRQAVQKRYVALTETSHQPKKMRVTLSSSASEVPLASTTHVPTTTHTAAAMVFDEDATVTNPQSIRHDLLSYLSPAWLFSPSISPLSPMLVLIKEEHREFPQGLKKIIGLLKSLRHTST